jgi:N-acetylglutamate synthase-like GNAT family acetyltransferase
MSKAQEWLVCQSDSIPDDVARMLATVPEWFGDPQSNAEYSEDARTKETWTISDNGKVIGVILLSRHFPQTAEIHFMVVAREYHGQGVGTALVEAISADAKENDLKLLEVKTLGASHPDKNYARTRHFYEKLGFIPLEETELWGADTPCLIMVKPL